jgi:putative FmdB family regulatory protein
MPIYEYNCNKCGVFEVSQHINDAPLSKCPHCRGKVRKLISQTSFQLKGSGWYLTDYGKGNGGGNGKSKKPTSNEKTETDKAAETPKTETKTKETSSTTKTSS